MFGNQIKYDPPLWTLGIELFGSMILLAYFSLKPFSRNFFSIATQAIALVLLTLYMMNNFGPSWPSFLSIIVGGYLWVP